MTGALYAFYFIAYSDRGWDDGAAHELASIAVGRML